MSLRPVLALVAAVLVLTLGGCQAFQSSGVPAVTVENRDDRQYRLTAYAVPDANTPRAVPFRATTPGGERRYVSPDELQSGVTYRNVTVTADGNRSKRVEIAPTDTTATTIDPWTPGDTIVYVVETVDDREALVALEVINCEQSGQEHSLTLQSETKQNATATCPERAAIAASLG